MQKNLGRILAFTLTGLVSLAITTNAHADRRSSLAGNLLITDQDDVYLYPQTALDHRNLVSFDFFPGGNLQDYLGGGDPEAQSLQNGSASMGGSALLLFGQEGFAFGLSTHREDYFGSTPGAFLGMGDIELYGGSRAQSWGYLGYSKPVPGAGYMASSGDDPGNDPAAGGGDFIEPLQLVDVLAAFDLSKTSTLGFRLSLGQNGSKVNFQQPDGNSDTQSWNSTIVDLVVGFSLDGEFRLDLNLELGLAFFSDSYVTDREAPNYEDSGTFAPSFSLSGRAFIPLRESVSLGVLAVIHVNTASFDDDFGATNTVTPDTRNFNSSNFFLETGLGPVYELPDKTIIAAYATLGFGASSYEDNTEDQQQNFSTSALLLPGVKLSLEHWVFDWLAFRSGISSRYHFQFQTLEYEDDNTANVSASSSYYEFLWSVGVGVKVGNFGLNGTLQTPFVTNGPEFLGGTSSGLFSLLNVTYKF